MTTRASIRIYVSEYGEHRIIPREDLAKTLQSMAAPACGTLINTVLDSQWETIGELRTELRDAWAAGRDISIISCSELQEACFQMKDTGFLATWWDECREDIRRQVELFREWICR